MNPKTLALAVVAVFLACALAVPVACDPVAADNSFDIKDGADRTTSFDAPADHVISIGKGASATVIELGYLDKIVVVDKYSNDKNEPVFAELNKKVDNGEIKAGGTVWKSGIEQLKKDILDSSDPAQGGKFDRTKDVVILTASKSSANPVLDFLVGNGFKHILVWYDITEYAEIIDFVDKVSMSLSGGKSDLAAQMQYVTDHVKDELAKAGTPAKKAFFVTFSSSNFKVGNSGSIATSLIMAAGGDAYTVDSSKDKPTYAANLPDIYEKGNSPVVFVDESSIWSSAEKLGQLKTQLPGAQLVPLESLWNNYCPDSMEGVWTMACAMYPELFEGDVPTVPEDGSDNLVLYVVAGIVVVLVVAAVAYLMIKKKKA